MQMRCWEGNQIYENEVQGKRLSRANETGGTGVSGGIALEEIGVVYHLCSWCDWDSG